MSDLPHLMTDGIVCNSLASGMLEVVLVRDGKHYNSNQLEPKNASRIAATVLNGAKLAAQTQEKKTPASTETAAGWEVAIPSRIGLGPSNVPGHDCLIVRFGEADLGFSILRSELRKLGEAIIALSSKGARE
jgi:hypothetical protein